MTPDSSAKAETTTGHAVMLFDGECNFCDTTVQFIIRRDPQGYIQFAPLQSETGQRLLAEHGLSPEPETMVLIEDGKAYTRSLAALRVAYRLNKGWPLFYHLFRWVPAPIRDFFYKMIARNRYRLFGKRESCMMPTPEIRARFLT
jgi:predicted DCC family thiol-disulfide oxidoreductase YuxK